MEIEDHDLSEGGVLSWRRPEAPNVDSKRDSIVIQTVDLDYVVEPSPSNRLVKNPVIRMYGVTEQGNTVLAFVHGFVPYFYVACWPGFEQRDVQLFGEALNVHLENENRRKEFGSLVRYVDVVRTQSLWGFHLDKEANFLKIGVAIPAMVASSRRILERGIMVGGTQRRFTTYESNMPYVLRFMIDMDMQGSAWVELKAGKYVMRTEKNKISNCQYEVEVMDVGGIETKPPQGEWMKHAPLRILSFDIECAGRKDHFPEAKIDPVIQIANVLSVQGQAHPVAKNVFTLDTCAPVVGAQIISCERERDLLVRWREFMIAADPDVIVGYNIQNFDFPYLLDRATALKVDMFPFLGRLKNEKTRMKDQTFSSKAYGTTITKDIGIDGRILFDLLPVIRREYKLRSYTLNSVCAHFLKQQKEDVHYSIISDLQNGNEETRKRLAVYCLKDAILPMKLLDKLLLLVNNVEMARVTGVPVPLLLSRGQQIKVMSQLYRKARQRNLIVPVREKQVLDEKYEGAKVFEPVKGFYKDPIATLDFASLYPSIMMAHNLCYSTRISDGDAKSWDPEGKKTIRTPAGFYFVKAEYQRGLLPEILSELLEARSKAKKDMKDAKDTLLKNVLNGRQLALKISANSVYGFTGAQVGQLPCLEISSSVTAFGRDMIEMTKKRVEEKFPGSLVIYGDTDSVMVKFPTSSVEEAMKLGREAAQYVSTFFHKPISLEFEKVYYPYLLMQKKRYAGMYWSNPTKFDKMDAKGIETVRRDNCPLVAVVVSEVLRHILIESSIDSAVEYTKRIISDLLCNRLDLSLLVISKSLVKVHTDDYKAKQAHVELAERMRKRDPSNAPKVGDRIPYVIFKAPEGTPAYKKAEDPIYVLEHDIPIDTQYYLENQLQQPLTRIFEPILPNVDVLFRGDHTLSIKIATGNVSGGIAKFAVKQRTCPGCKVVLSPNEERSICNNCKPNQAELYVDQIAKVRLHETAFNRLWAQCQRCQGSLHQDVLCTSKDCPIFYRRRKVQKDLQEAHVSLDQFSF